jgi:hypothetical protein
MNILPQEVILELKGSAKMTCIGIDELMPALGAGPQLFAWRHICYCIFFESPKPAGAERWRCQKLISGPTQC